MLTFQSHDEVVAEAIRFIEQSLRQKTQSITCHTSAKRLFFQLFNLTLGSLEHEEMHVALLDGQNKLIDTVCVGRGTLDHCAVYTREIAKLVLMSNAKGIILAHNHPSGFEKPSPEDIAVTKRIQEALSLIDAHVCDHIIVTRTFATTYSMTENNDF